MRVGDDTIGRVEGLLTGFDDHITAVLVASGHPWARRTIAVPVAALTRVDSTAVTVAATWGMA